MATIPFSDIVQFILFGAAATAWLLARFFGRRKYRRPSVPPQIPTVQDIPALITEELIRELTELRPDLSPRQVRETVKVFLIRYESERRFEDEG